MTGVWPTKELTYYFGINAEGLDLAMLRAQYQRAWQTIDAACGLMMTEVDSPSAANIVALSTPIDGAGKDLALSQEPENIAANAQLIQRFDVADLVGMGAAEAYVMFLHEDGHSVGRDHSPNGVESVMSAYLNLSLTGLTPYDDNELQSMYGAPTGPTPTGAVDFSGPVTLEFDIPAAGTYTLTIDITKKA